MSAYQSSSNPVYFFVFIGIGYYARGNKWRHLRDLKGAVNDVEDMKKYIKSKDFPGARMFELTSSLPAKGSNKPKEDEAQLPTYDNIVRLFEHVAAEIKRVGGGIVHLHFSCHGVTVETNYPSIKGQGGRDEAIAPYDIHKTGKPLRDIELAMLINGMTKNGARASAVFDCCHAGSVSSDEEEEDSSHKSDSEDASQYEHSTSDENSSDGSSARSGSQIEHGGVIRGLSAPQQVQSEGRESIPFPHEDNNLKDKFKKVWDPEHMSPTGGLLLLPLEYDMFAGSCLDEKAREDIFNGRWNGIFSHHFLEALRICENRGGTPTLRQIYQQVLGLFRDAIAGGNSQTPVFVGDENRHWLQTTEGYDIKSLKVHKLYSDKVILSEGAVQGVTKGSTYAIYEDIQIDLEAISTKPLVKVDQVYPGTCSATWVGRPLTVKPGAEAVLFKYKIDDIRVYMNPAAPDSDGASSLKYEELRVYVEQQKEPGDDNYDMVEFIVRTSAGPSDTAPYSVSLDPDLNYQLTSSVDGQPIPRFPPSDSAWSFYRRLTHLARFESLKKLRNPAPPRHMNNCLDIKINGESIMHYCAWNPIQLEDRPPLDVKVGLLSVQLENKTQTPFKITGFDFNPFWRSYKFHPVEDGENFDTILPREQNQTQWEVSEIPQDWDRSFDYIDYVKFIISEKSLAISTFNSMVMDDLTSGESRGGGVNLDDLLESMGAHDRGFRPSRRGAPSPWTTLMFRIRTIE